MILVQCRSREYAKWKLLERNTHRVAEVDELERNWKNRGIFVHRTCGKVVEEMGVRANIQPGCVEGYPGSA
jgi:hypothetical protein